MASLIDQKNVVSKSIFGLVTVTMRVFVADYHVGSHTRTLRFLLSGVARSGKLFKHMHSTTRLYGMCNSLYYKCNYMY